MDIGGTTDPIRPGCCSIYDYFADGFRRCNVAAVAKYTDIAAKPPWNVVFYRCEHHDRETIGRGQTTDYGGRYRREKL